MCDSAPSRTVLIHEFVTGGGLAGERLPRSWASEGGAMRRALAADFAAVPNLTVVVTLDHRLPDQPGPCRTVRVGVGQEQATLSRLTANADYTIVVAPETGGILADRARLVAQAGGLSLGSTAEAIEIAGDKVRLASQLSTLGIPTPYCRTVVPAEGLPTDAIYPAVLKPIDGAGSIATYYVTDPHALPSEALELGRALFQPLVEGQPMSASFLVDADGRAHLVGIGYQHIELLQSRFVYRGGTVPADPRPPCGLLHRAVESVRGLRGFIGVDFLWNAPARLVTVLEINPRPTTSYVGLIRLLPAGALAQAWLALTEDPRAGELPDLAELVHAQAPYRFSAEGEP